MNKVGGYGVYQSSFYDKSIQSKKDKVEAKDKSETTKKADVLKKQPVELSEKAKKLLKELQVRYDNMDIMVANYDTEEEAARYLSRGTKEYSVLIDVEELEKMAEDEEYKNKNLELIEDATKQLDTMKEQLGDEKDEITHLGVSIGKDGTLSFFADLEKLSDKQRERIHRARTKQKEAAHDQVKSKQKEAAHDQVESKQKDEEARNQVRLNQKEEVIHDVGKRARVSAGNVEELLEKIHSFDWSKVKEEDSVLGRKMDYSI